jgi:hypothetical protein
MSRYAGTPTHYTVYRLFDADGRLLYVGCTGNLSQRLHHHRLYRPWWSEVSLTMVEHFDTKAEALATEREAIDSEGARYNARRSTPEKPEKPCGRPRVEHPGVYERWRDGETLEEISHDYGVTRERVRQWIARDNPKWLISLTRQLHAARTRTRNAVEKDALIRSQTHECRVCGAAFRRAVGITYPLCDEHLPVSGALRLALNIGGRYDAWRLCPSVRGGRADAEAPPNRRFVWDSSRLGRLYREAIEKDWPLVADIPAPIRERLMAAAS